MMLQNLCAWSWTRDLPAPKEIFWFGLHNFCSKGKSVCSEQWQKYAYFYLDWYKRSSISLELSLLDRAQRTGLDRNTSALLCFWQGLKYLGQIFRPFNVSLFLNEDETCLSVYLSNSLKHTWFAKYLIDEKSKYLSLSKSMAVFYKGWWNRFLSLKLHIA